MNSSNHLHMIDNAAEAEYPRVLVVYHSCINKADQHGVSIRNWFADWPRERVAQVYSGNEVGEDRFFKYTYRIGPLERRFGSLFFRIKGKTLESSRSLLLNTGDEGRLASSNWMGIVKNRLSRFLIRAGLWEVLFKPIVSHRMAQWIEKFNPDIIYAQGYTLSFAWLPVLLHKRLGIPICFQTGDDWPRFLYRDGAASLLVRPFVDRAARKLIACSSVRFSNGDRMSREYARRYGLLFVPLMMCDSWDRFKEATPRRLVDNDTISILYSGGLGHDRWHSIADLAAAAALLGCSGYRVKISVLASEVPKEALSTLAGLDNTEVLPPPKHEDLPGLLKAADILFLPETFDPAEVEVIGLSISTKAHLYMMSERPILVYGAASTGVVDYARTCGWGHVVDVRDIELLASAVKRLASDGFLRDELVSKGLHVALDRHDAHRVRERFREAILAASSGNRMVS